MNLFIYIRLSMADSDLKYKNESESISNQRALLRRYIETHPDLAGCVSEEFIDDGYSGTTGDRPAFERMIERVKNGEADIIICKDFSRFFRDYIEIGDYLEKIFPFLGVRFISVNDNYDSDEYKGTTAGIEVVMKYIVYASYSRDLSQKIKTVINSKQRKGKWVGSDAPYGYIKDPENKHHLILNPDTAPVVRQIFDLALNGKKIMEIARILNDDGIETPAQYYMRTHADSKKYTSTSKQSCWDKFNVHRILHTKMYTGAMVSNLRTWKSIDRQRTFVNDESKWIVVPNCHEAIVTDEEFKQAQGVIRNIKKSQRSPRDYLLRSLLVCGSCGRVMTYFSKCKKKYYKCIKSVTDSNTACPVNEKFYEDELSCIIIQDLKEKLQLFVDNQKRLKEADKVTLGSESNIKANIGRAEKLLKQKSYERKAAYEKYVDEIITKDEFLVIKGKLSADEEQLRDEVGQYKEKLKKIETQKNDTTAKLAEKAEDFLSLESFNNEMLLYFIEKVNVYSDMKIEIVYRFKDLFEDALTVE